MKRSESRSIRARRAARAALGCAAILLLGPARARAGTLASGFLWSENADRMVCFVWNVSDAPVTLQSAKIVNEEGNAFATFGNCNGTLQPGKRCGFVAYNLQQAGGRVSIDVPRNRIRGTCQLLDDNVVTLATTEMR
jgi:hypothetical protein